MKRGLMNVEVRVLTSEELGRLKDVASEVWFNTHNNDEYIDIFDRGFVDFSLGGSHEKENRMFGAFCGNTMLGFVGITVFHAAIRGKTYKLCSWTWLTVNKHVREKIRQDEGILDLCWEPLSGDRNFTTKPNQPVSHILNAAVFYYCLENSIDALVSYQEGDAVYRIVSGFCNSCGYIKRRYMIKFTYPFIRIVNLEEVLEKKNLPLYQKIGARLLGIDHIPEPGKYADRIDDYLDTDIEDCLELLNSIKDTVGLAKVWTQEELAWQLGNRDISGTMVFRDGRKVIGLLNYLKIDSVSVEGTFTYALLDNIHIQNLSDEQKKSLIFHFLRRIKGQGFTGAMFWHEGYFDERILKKTGFMKLKRYHCQSFHTFNEEIDVDGMKETYVRFR